MWHSMIMLSWLNKNYIYNDLYNTLSNKLDSQQKQFQKPSPPKK